MSEHRLLNKDEYPRLFQFFGGYLNQDWSADYDSWQSAVRYFLQSERHDIVVQTALELQDLIARSLPEPELRKLLLDLACAYRIPDQDSLSYAGWIRRISSILSSASQDAAD